MNADECATVPLPSDPALLRELYREAIRQRVLFYQTFLYDRIKGRPVHLVNSLNDFDIDEIRQKTKRSDNDGGTVPGFAISTQSYWQPQRRRAKAGIHGLVEKHLSHDQQCRLAAAHDRISLAREGLIRVVYEHTIFGAGKKGRKRRLKPVDNPTLRQRLQGALQERDAAIREIIIVYQEFADAIKVKLDDQPADKKSGGSSPERPKWDGVTEARNKWIYYEACRGTKYTTIISRLRRKPKGWLRISSINGIKRAAHRYAKWAGLPPPPPRQSGRPAR